MLKDKPEVRCVLPARAINGESPAWCPQEAVLYWVDVKEPSLHRFDPATGRDRCWLCFRNTGGGTADAPGVRRLLRLTTIHP